MPTEPTTQTTQTDPPAQTTNAPITVPETFTPDANKSQADNDSAKAAWEVAKKAQDDAKAVAAAQTPEQKAAAEKAAVEQKTKDDAAKANDTKVNPFKVEEIKLPDGIEADKALQDGFVKLVNEHGIPRSAAAALIDLQANAMKAASEANSKLWNDTQEKWQNESKADSEIGGDKLQPALTSISKLVDHYGGTPLREALDVTGAGNHPIVIKAFAKIAKDLGESYFVSGSATNTPQSAADRIYGTAKT